jgi:hypothetical protein
MKYYPVYFVREVIADLTATYPRGWELVGSLFACNEETLVDVFVRDSKLWYRLKRLLQYVEDKLDGTQKIRLSDVGLERLLQVNVVFRDFWRLWKNFAEQTTSELDYYTYVKWNSRKKTQKGPQSSSPEHFQLDLDFENL